MSGGIKFFSALLFVCLIVSTAYSSSVASTTDESTHKPAPQRVTFADFKDIHKGMSYNELIKVVGQPTRYSGVGTAHVAYDFSDGRTVWIAFQEKKTVSAFIAVKGKKTESLF